MNEYIFDREFDGIFINRKRELNWLDQELFNENSFRPILIWGKGGIGKTALIKYWLHSRRISTTPLWIDANKLDTESILNFIENRYESDRHEDYIVVIDNSDNLTDEEYSTTTQRLYNRKAVKSVIFISRNVPKIERSKVLELSTFNEIDSEQLIKSLIPGLISDPALIQAINAVNGYPLAISLLSELLKSGKINSLSSFLNKPLYSLNNGILLPEKEIISTFSPIIVFENERVVSALKKNPTDLYKLSPREFEKTLAELLRDMGWEVELTKQTRDGGADILAYLNTDVGRLLCLVEAKKYREDRKIGVDLVRTLYGTLCDAQANSAMLVTTSSFSKDAQKFQQKHQYQLSLRDYTDLVNWIMKYGNNRNTPNKK
jgi:HJR/Mrr/RecB family endonuclease